jgi:hypothetical protein
MFTRFGTVPERRLCELAVTYGIPKSVNESTNLAVGNNGSSAAHDAVMELP